MFKFSIIWFGQIISQIGSGLTSFALGVWVFRRTGSVTNFALIYAFTVLPNVLLAPIAGAIVDRWNRRTIMLCSDLIAGLSTFLLAVLFFTHLLRNWEIYLLVAISSMGTAFRYPSYAGLLSQLVPSRHVGRASGMIQIGPPAAQLISPALAAALIEPLGYGGIVSIDAITFLFAVISLSAIKVPDLPPSKQARKGSLVTEVLQGWRYIMTEPGFRELLVLFVFLNITYSLYQALLTPVILGFTTTVRLGAIMSTGAVGFLFGGLLLSFWGGPKRRVRALLVFSIPYGIGLVMSGLRPSVPLLTVAVFVTLFQVPLINGCNQAVWQIKTAPELQGRIFSIRTMIGWSATPLVFFLAGPIADHLFEPLLRSHGRFATYPLSLIGTGPGRGAALLLILNGVFALAITTVSSFNRNLRRLDETEMHVEATATL